jgi:hypothetical protein
MQHNDGEVLEQGWWGSIAGVAQLSSSKGKNGKEAAMRVAMAGRKRPKLYAPLCSTKWEAPAGSSNQERVTADTAADRGAVKSSVSDSNKYGFCFLAGEKYLRTLEKSWEKL